MGLKSNISGGSFPWFSDSVISELYTKEKLNEAYGESQAMGSINKTCVVCQSPSSKICAACHGVAYCSSEHQKLDWKAHKNACCPYKILQNERLGRYVVAVRNIPRGSIILTERPIVIGPKIYSPPVCLGCHRRVGGTYFCSKCGFPMCSVDCEKMAIHSENECAVFQAKGSSPKKILDYDKPNPLYQSILTLRCLLLRGKSPSQWELLNTLEHHSAVRERESEVWNEHQTNIVQFLREWHNLKDEFGAKDVNSVIGYIEVNSFQIKTIKNIEICGLFKLGAMMSHDCVANTHHAFAEDGRLILRSSIDIRKGDLITMCYVDSEAGTLERRKLLQTTKYFSCACTRCADPTELRTYTSALKCPLCHPGYLLPENPLNAASGWSCYDPDTHKPNSVCPKSMTADEVTEELSKISSTLQPLTTEPNIEILENVLQTYAGKILHSNHFLLIPLWKQLQSIYLLKSDLKCLHKNKSIVLKLLNVLDVLDIGYSRSRGLLLYQLYKLNNELTQIQLENHEITPEAYQAQVLGSAEAKKELEKIFELDLIIGVKRS